MKRLSRIFILSLFIGLSISGCVSVNLSGSKGKPAKDVEYSAPATPFKSIKSPNSDKTWLSEKTGNTISYLSECGGSADPSLSAMESETLGVLEKLQIVSSEATQFNGREAQRTIATGEIDGVPVKLSLMLFKKNNCNYTLSYGGVAKEFVKEDRYFDEFLKSFKAQ